MDPLREAESAESRILLVDDDVQLVRGLCVALQNHGYEVAMLARGDGVMEVIGRVHPSLVVLDVMMPGVDGWEVLRRIRQDPATASLPVIMLTAKDSEEAKVLGFELGADDYLTKPFSVRELRCRVRAILRRSSSEVEEPVRFPVVLGTAEGHELVDAREVLYIEGVRNYTYLHTADRRFLSRLSLGAAEEHCKLPLMRVHRSFIVNLDRVAGCRWANKSSYRLRLGEGDGREIPVSRRVVGEVQRRLGLK